MEEYLSLSCSGTGVNRLRVRIFLIFFIFGLIVMSTPPVFAKNFEALKHIPTIDIVREAATGPTLRLLFEQERAETFAKLEALDPDMKALMWLCFLDQRWGRDGLHTYFFMFGGDFAPQVLAALRHAKMEREATVFGEAMDLFGPIYPTDLKEREKHFAWSRPGRKVDESTTIPNELNAFDQALMEKGGEFGTQHNYAKRIAAYVENTPSLMAWADKARTEMTDEQRLNWLLRQLTVNSWERASDEIATWPQPYRQLFLLELFNAEMLNGGVHQFFSNSSGDFAVEVVATMRDVGLPRHAAALQRSVDMFEKPYPSNRDVRHMRYFSKEWSDWDERLNEPTGDVDDGEIIDKMMDIARQGEFLPR